MRESGPVIARLPPRIRGGAEAPRSQAMHACLRSPLGSRGFRLALGGLRLGPAALTESAKPVSGKTPQNPPEVRTPVRGNYVDAHPNAKHRDFY